MNYLKYTNYSDIVEDKNFFKDSILDTKVLVIKNYLFEKPIVEFFSDYINNIGKIIDSDEDQNSGETTGQQFIEISYDPCGQNKYRTAKSNQPLHTDCSYIDINNTIQFLMCLKQAPFGGATTFIDTKKLVDLLFFDGEDLLYNDLLKIPVAHLKGNRRKIRPILEIIDDQYNINWNYPPATRAGNTIEAVSVINRFKNWLETRIEQSGLLTEVLLNKNDVVLFHDYKVLHGRNSYFAKNKGDRCLQKGTLVLN